MSRRNSACPAVCLASAVSRAAACLARPASSTAACLARPASKSWRNSVMAVSKRFSETSRPVALETALTIASAWAAWTPAACKSPAAASVSNSVDAIVRCSQLRMPDNVRRGTLRRNRHFRLFHAYSASACGRRKCSRRQNAHGPRASVDLQDSAHTIGTAGSVPANLIRSTNGSRGQDARPCRASFEAVAPAAGRDD